jgi:hypothetical protein
MDPGASGPNGEAAATRIDPTRLRRRAPAIQGSADRHLARDGPSVIECGIAE